MAMKKMGGKGIGGRLTGGGAGPLNPSPRGSSTSKKQSNLRYDSQKNLLHRLSGGGAADEPPKFSHHAAPKNAGVHGANSIFSPKTASTTAGAGGFISTDFSGGTSSSTTKKGANPGKRPSTNTLTAKSGNSSNNVRQHHQHQQPGAINSLQ